MVHHSTVGFRPSSVGGFERKVNYDLGSQWPNPFLCIRNIVYIEKRKDREMD